MEKENNKKPGVMVYFELLPLLEQLGDASSGCLFRAILSYGQSGTVPTFDDPTLRAVWVLIQRSIDVDDEAYRRKVEQKRRAANKRWGRTEDDADDADAYPALQKMPTPTSAPAPTAAPTAAPRPKSKSTVLSKEKARDDSWMDRYA